MAQVERGHVHRRRTRRRPVLSGLALGLALIALLVLLLVSGVYFLRMVVPFVGLGLFGILLAIAGLLRHERPKPVGYAALAVQVIVTLVYVQYLPAGTVALGEYLGN